jgi:hypothetical protein
MAAGAHAPDANRRQDLIRPDGLADHEWHRFGVIFFHYRRGPCTFIRRPVTSGMAYRLKPLINTMSFVIVPRATARRLPSCDQAKSLIVGSSVK